MKSFKYRAKKGPSEIVEGILAAESREIAIDKVNELGLVPVDIQEASGETAEKHGAPRPRAVRGREIFAFYRQMARLTKSGVPLLQGLFLLSQENGNRYFRAVLADLYQQVREGNTLSAAMARHPKIFTPFDAGMVQTGESAGRLDEVLSTVAEYRRRQQELISKVRGALVYPAFITFMGAVTVIFMLTNVVPKFARFFKDLGQELPAMTRLLMALSDGMQTYGLGIVCALAGAGLFLAALSRKPEHRLPIDRLLLRLPLAGSVWLKSEIARFCRTLELLLKSGVPVLNALRISTPVVRNAALRKSVESCYAFMEEGGYLSEALKKAGYFPSFVCYFTGIGEESGKLEETLGEIAEWYEQETAESVKIMTSLLEPAIILVLGVVLGLIIIAVLLPVFSINAMVV